jgi:ribosome biogenesis GTPase / thiamine phosphate phosphatase
LKGIVTKSTGSWYTVRTEDNNYIECRIKGKFRLEDRRSSNPITVGDVVNIEAEEDKITSVITEIYPRKNYIIRQSSKSRTAEHIIAANLDQAIVLVTISMPRTSAGFIDRFLVTAGAYHVPSVIIFNKTDIYSKKEKEKLNEFNSIYIDAGYMVLAISAATGENMGEVQQLLKNKITLMCGHSGSGKSTLINKIYPEFKLKTGAISTIHDKGMHTTTFAEMLELPSGGFIIDTPGIKEFGILDFEPAEVSQFFPEMTKLASQCKFNDCLHINEPKCAVKEAVVSGEISESRYNSYLGIIAELQRDEKIYD